MNVLSTELEEIFLELLLGKTDKVSKVADASVLRGIAAGSSNMGRKIAKDITIIHSHVLPDTAFGNNLDKAGRLRGIPERFLESRSSTYVLVVGTPGTTYEPGTHVFSGSTSIKFDVITSYTIGPAGYGYVRVRSQQSGSNTNVPALSINRVTPMPIGHEYCVNEYAPFEGRDEESDALFKKRIKDGPNVLAKSIISSLEQTFMKINNSVLRVIYQGLNANSEIVLSILTENGAELSPSELTTILSKGEKYFSMNELRPDGFGGYGIQLVNVQFQPLDVSMRLELFPGTDPDVVRKAMQPQMNKYLDYRFWKKDQKVEWDDLLAIAKKTSGVKYVYDNFFFPDNDVAVDPNKLPRIRGFQLLDKNGALLSDGGNVLNPFYFPAPVDFGYRAAVLNSI